MILHKCIYILKKRFEIINIENYNIATFKFELYYKRNSKKGNREQYLMMDLVN